VATYTPIAFTYLGSATDLIRTTLDASLSTSHCEESVGRLNLSPTRPQLVLSLVASCPVLPPPPAVSSHTPTLYYAPREARRPGSVHVCLLLRDDISLVVNQAHGQPAEILSLWLGTTSLTWEILLCLAIQQHLRTRPPALHQMPVPTIAPS
jgi:hypothetical protein